MKVWLAAPPLEIGAISLARSTAMLSLTPTFAAFSNGLVGRSAVAQRSGAMTMGVESLVGASEEISGKVWDPLKLSQNMDEGNLNLVRAAELKHCRVSMLAFVGMIFTDFYTLPGYEFSTLEAHDAGVANGSMSQLLLWLGLLEFFSFIGIDQMLRGSGREPGDYGATHHVATLCSHAT